MILDASSSASGIITYITGLFDDLLPIILLILGIALALWIIEEIVGAIRK